MRHKLLGAAILPLIIASVTTLNVFAQDSETRTRIVKRVVEPAPFWIDANKLHVRDDPFAGNQIDTLERGQKVKVYEQLENWMRISPDGHKANWINGNYTSASRVTWANYSSLGANRRQTLNGTVLDIDLQSIPVEGDSQSEIFSAKLRILDLRRRVIDTRHNSDGGRYYERYLVQCDFGKPSHARLLGEGYNYVSMHRDTRNEYLSSPLSSFDKIDVDATPADRQAIAKYACGGRG